MEVNHDIVRQAKTLVHRPRGTYLPGTFLLDRELSDWAEGGNLPSWSKKQRALSPSFLSVALPVSFIRFSTKETTFRRKADNFAYFSHLLLQQISAIQIG